MKSLFPWQHDAWSALQGLRARLPHAILIKGMQGVGKLQLAMRYSQSLLCQSPDSVSMMPCDQCDSCRWFDQGTHPDFRLIQPDSLNKLNDDNDKDPTKKLSNEIGVDQIRALANFTNLSSHQGGYRVALITPAESMNINAANAVLKTLEEPADNLLFILVSHKPQQLLATILSRCISLAIAPPSRDQGLAWLVEQGIKKPEESLAQSGYAPLLALDSLSTEEDSDVRQILLGGIRNPENLDSILLAEKFQRSAPGLVVHHLQQWCYDLNSVKLAGEVRYFPDQLGALEKLIGRVPLLQLMRFQNELKTAKREALHPLNTRLQLESIFFSYKQMFDLKVSVA